MFHTTILNKPHTDIYNILYSTSKHIHRIFPSNNCYAILWFPLPKYAHITPNTYPQIQTHTLHAEADLGHECQYTFISQSEHL